MHQPSNFKQLGLPEGIINQPRTPTQPRGEERQALKPPEGLPQRRSSTGATRRRQSLNNSPVLGPSFKKRRCDVGIERNPDGSPGSETSFETRDPLPYEGQVDIGTPDVHVNTEGNGPAAKEESASAGPRLLPNELLVKIFRHASIPYRGSQEGEMSTAQSITGLRLVNERFRDVVDDMLKDESDGPLRPRARTDWENSRELMICERQIGRLLREEHPSDEAFEARLDAILARSPQIVLPLKFKALDKGPTDIDPRRKQVLAVATKAWPNMKQLRVDAGNFPADYASSLVESLGRILKNNPQLEEVELLLDGVSVCWNAYLGSSLARLSKTHPITALDFSGNQEFAAGGWWLLRGFSESRLERLRLSGCDIGNLMCNSLVYSLPSSIRELDLSNNRIPITAVSYLLAVAAETCLERVDLRGNGLDPSSLEKLKSQARNVRGNPIDIRHD